MSQQPQDNTARGASDVKDEWIRNINETSKEAGASLRDATRKVADAATEFGDRALERGASYGNDIAKQVEEQPMMAMLIGAGIGLIAGWLLARR